MPLNLSAQDLEKFIVVGDRVLIRPKTPNELTRSGLFLPPGVEEREKLRSGYILKIGPGYPVPDFNNINEPWKAREEEVRYVPLQAKSGDLAVYLQREGFELEFNGETYIIVPHSAILLLIRDEELFE